MARHTNRDTVMRCNTCSAAASRHKEACPARGQSSSLRSSTNPYALPRVRFFFVSLWRATQIGIRCLEMWIFCLFLFNTFVFVKMYRLLPDLQKHLFALFPFRRAIRRLAPQGGKALRVARQRSARARIPAHCRARAILSSFLMARHANRDTVSPISVLFFCLCAVCMITGAP